MVNMINKILIEQLANLEHEQWSHWTKYMFENMSDENRERWKVQWNTKYKDLSEKEKDSDREWAYKVLKIFENKVQNAQKRLKEDIDKCGFSKTTNLFLKERIKSVFINEFGDRIMKEKDYSVCRCGDEYGKGYKDERNDECFCSKECADKCYAGDL